MRNACDLSIIDRRLGALKLLDEFVARRKTLIQGDELAGRRQNRRRRDGENAKGFRDVWVLRGVHVDYP